jgi:hypothetical protein
MGTWAKLLGTLASSFGFGAKGTRLTLDYSALTADRTVAVPDRAGTLALASLNVITDATTARTLSAADCNAYVRMTSSSANTVTAPSDTTASGVAVGYQFHIRNAGTGTTTIVADTGVTINKPSTLVLAANGAVTLVKVASNIYDLMGLTT